jgi:DNA polymerase I
MSGAKSPTGRLYPSEPAPQNIPVRTELGSEIRRAFLAEPERRLCSVDYSKIEHGLEKHQALAVAYYIKDLNSRGHL